MQSNTIISSYRILSIIFSHIQADLSVSNFAAQLRSWSILSELVKINFHLGNGIETKKATVLGEVTPFPVQCRLYCYRVQYIYSVTSM